MTIEEAQHIRVGDRIRHSGAVGTVFTVLRAGIETDGGRPAIWVSEGHPMRTPWHAWVEYITLVFPRKLQLPEGV